jgi:ribosomal protein S18 acetylase RimI-like enzyme
MEAYVTDPHSIPSGAAASAGFTGLAHADDEADVRACYRAMLTLRPHLGDEDAFAGSVQRMSGQGYRILAGWEEGEVVALAGYRICENLVHGRFLYVDDLVTLARARGRRWGAQLMEALAALARDQRCAHVVLDTGLSNVLAQRFYFRNGLLPLAMHFVMPIQHQQR